jgi:methionyl-tRNA formyltransferase
MKIVLAGGMTITGQLLETLCAADAKPTHLFAYPPSLAERSNYADLEPVARQHGVPVTKAKNINDPAVKEEIARLAPDWLLVFGWSQLVHEDTLALARRGALGFHMTKLPEGRGRAPVAWTVIKGKTTGTVSLIWLKAGADNGEIAIQRDYPISLFDDAQTVVDRVAETACGVLRDAVPMLRANTLPKIPQDDAKATHWEKRTPEDGLVDWRLPPRELYNFIRGVAHPFPGAFAHLGGEKITLWRAGLVEGVEPGAAPGTVLGPYFAPVGEAGVAVALKDAVLVIRDLETPRGRLGGMALVEQAQAWKGKQLEGKSV